jgi:hypothetical protein
MSEIIRASIPEKKSDGVAHTATEYLAIVEKQHDTHSKAYASTLINKLTTASIPFPVVVVARVLGFVLRVLA